MTTEQTELKVLKRENNDDLTVISHSSKCLMTACFMTNDPKVTVLVVHSDNQYQTGDVYDGFKRYIDAFGKPDNTRRTANAVTVDEIMDKIIIFSALADTADMDVVNNGLAKIRAMISNAISAQPANAEQPVALVYESPSSDTTALELFWMEKPVNEFTQRLGIKSGDFLYAKSQPVAVIPEGWQVVPVEPTAAMLEAADGSDWEYTKRTTGLSTTMIHQSGYDHHLIMLKAAPPAPIQTISKTELEGLRRDSKRWKVVEYQVMGQPTPYGNPVFSISNVKPVAGANIMRGSLSEHFTNAIDAAIKAQEGE